MDHNGTNKATESSDETGVTIAKAPFNLFGLETLPRKPLPAHIKRGAMRHVQRI